MLKRHEATGGGMDSSATLLISAALLAMLAGTPLGLAQNTQPGEYDPVAAGEDSFFEDGADDTAMSEADFEPVELNADDVRVDGNELITLHFRDEDLTTALQMLAMQAQRNIVPTRNVSGTVTANLYGQTFENVLDAILLYNGYGYIEEGNTIFVMPIEEIRQIEQESYQREHMLIRLNYLSAVDAAQFCQPLLSESGSITTNGVAGDYAGNNAGPRGGEDWALSATMLVVDYPDRIEGILSLVAELDTKPVSVLVEATILQSAITEANAFGVDFAIIAGLNFSDFSGLGGPLRVADGLISGGGSAIADPGDGDTGGSLIPDDGRGFGIQSTVGNTAAPGGFKVGIVHDDLAIFLRLLDEVGDTTIISNPKILTLNRQSASVQVGRRVGYLSTTTTQTTSSQTVEFLDTGTQLYFRPFVTNDRRIRMELQPKISQPIIRTVTDATGAGVTVPDEDTSQLSTNVLLNDGETVVLGGLFTERTITSRRQIPLLGDFPLIGPAFRGHDDTMQRTEIIFLITPSIVSDDDMSMAGNHANEYIEYARSGARAGLLPWSRDKRATQLLVDAQRLSLQGETNLALNKIRRSLTLSPTQPDAIEMRQVLMNDPGMWPNRSTLDHVLHDEAVQWEAAIKRANERRQQARNTSGTTDSSTVDPATSDATQPNFDELSEQTADENTDFSSEQVTSTEPVSDETENIAIADEPRASDESEDLAVVQEPQGDDESEDFAIVEEPQASNDQADPQFFDHPGSSDAPASLAGVPDQNDSFDDFFENNLDDTYGDDLSTETVDDFFIEPDNDAPDVVAPHDPLFTGESYSDQSAVEDDRIDLFETNTNPGMIPWQLSSERDPTALDFGTAFEVLLGSTENSPLTVLDGASESPHRIEYPWSFHKFGIKTALFGPWSLLTSDGDKFSRGDTHAEVLESDSFDDN